MKEEDWGLNVGYGEGICDEGWLESEQDEVIFRPTNEGVGNGFTGG
jgi:hypothetical protein